MKTGERETHESAALIEIAYPLQRNVFWGQRPPAVITTARKTGGIIVFVAKHIVVVIATGGGGPARATRSGLEGGLCRRHLGVTIAHAII
jgi:hypothetical protein